MCIYAQKCNFSIFLKNVKLCDNFIGFGATAMPRSGSERGIGESKALRCSMSQLSKSRRHYLVCTELIKMDHIHNSCSEFFGLSAKTKFSFYALKGGLKMKKRSMAALIYLIFTVYNYFL